MQTNNELKLKRFQYCLKEFRDTELTLSKNASMVVNVLKKFADKQKEYTTKAIYEKALRAFKIIAEGGDIWADIIPDNWDSQVASSDIIEKILEKLTDKSIQKRYECCALIAMYYEVPIKDILATVDKKTLSKYLQNDLAKSFNLDENERLISVEMRLSTPMQRLPRLVLFANEFHAIHSVMVPSTDKETSTARLLRKFKELARTLNDALAKLENKDQNMIISNSMQRFIDAMNADNILKKGINNLDNSIMSDSKVEETQPFEITEQPNILNMDLKTLLELSQIEEVFNPILSENIESVQLNNTSFNETNISIMAQPKPEHMSQTPLAEKTKQDSTKIILNSVIPLIKDDKVEQQQFIIHSKTPSSSGNKVIKDVVILTSIIISSTAIGAGLGALLGTFIIPGVLTIVGAALGAAFGGAFGLILGGFRGLIRNRLFGTLDLYAERVAAGMLTTLGATIYGALIGTILWPGMGSIIGGAVGLVIGALISITTAHAFNLEMKNTKQHDTEEPSFIADLNNSDVVNQVTKYHKSLFTDHENQQKYSSPVSTFTI